MRFREAMLNAATGIAVLSMLLTTGLVVRREFTDSTGPSARPAPTDRVVPDWRQLEKSGHRIGPANAKLTVVEFADFECPACAKTFPTIEAFRLRHPTEVAIVFRHWPLPYHRFAYPSARAAECAGNQGRFLEFYQQLYRKQDSLGLISFDSLAKASAVRDLEAFDRCASSTKSVLAIDADVKEAKRIEAWGTPTLIVNGLMLSKIPDLDTLEDLLSKAR